MKIFQVALLGLVLLVAFAVVFWKTPGDQVGAVNLDPEVDNGSALSSAELQPLDEKGLRGQVQSKPETDVGEEELPGAPVESGRDALPIAAMRIVDDVTGTPIAGATAVRSVFEGYHAAAPGEPIGAPSDAGGELRVPFPDPPTEVPDWRGVDPLHKAVTIQAPGYGQAVVALSELNIPPADPLEVRLSKGSALRVTILWESDKEPMPGGLTVALKCQLPNIVQPRKSLNRSGDVVWSAPLGADGSVYFGGLVAGAKLYGEVHQGKKVIWSSSAPLTLKRGETESVDWSIGGGAQVTVQLKEVDGSPTVDFPLIIDQAPASGARYEGRLTKMVKRQRTDETGTACFEAIPPGAHVLLIAEQHGQDGLENNARSVTPFEMPEGNPGVHLEATVHRGLYPSGTFLNSMGIPMHSGISAWGDGNLYFQAQSDSESGAFQIGPMLPGEYRVVGGGRDSDMKSLPLTVQAGESGLVVKARPGCMITGPWWIGSAVSFSPGRFGLHL